MNSAFSSSASTSRRPLKLGKAAALILSALFLGIAISGAAYQRISQNRDRRANPMPGELIEAGGRKMHIDCAGAGSPTVILDSGLGDSYYAWHKVQPAIARFTRVCSYDRAGIGYSETSGGRRTSRIFAQQLHQLLRTAEIAPPYLLSGHSMGGFDVRSFASLYRNEVAGVVLVDSSHPDQQNRLPQELRNFDASWVREQEFFEFTMPFGLPRLLGFCGNDAAERAASCNFHSLHENIAELKSVSESAAEAGASGTLGDLPLVVLTQDPNAPQYDLPEDLVKPSSAAWQQMQKELAQLSTRSTQIIAKNSGHYIQLDRPDLVIGAIRTMVDRARDGK